MSIDFRLIGRYCNALASTLPQVLTTTAAVCDAIDTVQRPMLSAATPPEDGGSEVSEEGE